MSGDLKPLSAAAQAFRPGVYRHFKGGMYRAVYVARHSEHPYDEFVVYTSLDGDAVWIRPLAMFCDEVVRSDYTGSRFIFLEEHGSAAT